MKKSFLKNTYILYTGSFLLLLPIVFLPFIIEGKSFVWNVDGINQHYPILQYYGNLLKALVAGKGFPMVDFKLGLGFDTITTLHYYVLGDPISLLSVFMTPENSVFFYDVLILLRFYLVGISFILFCKYWGKDNLGVILGALIYVFSGYTFYSGVRHPFFLNPMIYLPLIIIGLEQVLRRKRPYLVISMVFISTISNFYFLYILTMISIIYVIFRYIFTYRKAFKNTFIGLIITGARTGGYYLLGVAMAAIVLLPVLYAFMQNGRMENKPKMITGYLHYNKLYYLSLFQDIFASGVSPNFWVKLTFSSVTAVSIVILICNKKYRQLQIALLLAFCAIFVPAFGYFMNGFSYITNRWCFLISLLVAAAFALTYEGIFRLKKREITLMALGTAGYGVLAFFYPSKNIVKLEFFILLLTIILLLILQTSRFKKRKLLQEVCLYVLVIMTLGFNGYAYYSTQFHGYVNEFLTKGAVENLTRKGALSLIAEIEDDSFYRIETYGDTVRNEALCVGFNDVSGYFSLMDGGITSYFKQLELLNQRSAYRFDNFDNRTILDALASVKYFVSTNITAAPYAYQLLKKVVDGPNNYYLFENLFALPPGYTYESYMLREDYNKLSSLEKQNALMYAVVLDADTDFIAKTTQDMSVGIEKMDTKIYPDQNVRLEGNTIKVLRAGATITLVFNAKPKSETYVRIENFNMSKKAIAMTTFQVKGEKEVTKPVNLRSIYHNSYFGKDNLLINTGYSKIGKTWAVITFPKKATCSYNSLEVYNVAMENYRKQFEALNMNTLRNIKWKNNLVEGDISVDKKSVLSLSIPYSKGWCAYVDGEKIDILRGNVMFMAILLEAGSHHVILKYETPFLKVGGLVSFAAFMVLIGIIVWNKVTIRKRMKTEV